MIDYKDSVFMENFIVDSVSETKEIMAKCREIIEAWDDKKKLISVLEVPKLGLCSNLNIRTSMQEYFAKTWSETHINSNGLISTSYPVEGSEEYYNAGGMLSDDERILAKWSNRRRLKYAIHILETLEKLTGGRDGY